MQEINVEHGNVQSENFAGFEPRFAHIGLKGGGVTGTFNSERMAGENGAGQMIALRNEERVIHAP